MMELIILRIIEVHGDEPTPFSLDGSLPPTNFHAMEFYNSFHRHCLEYTLKSCEKKY
jgi:hypothetical protein